MQEPVMEGHGYYNAHSELQARSAQEADGVLERALAAVAIPDGVITLADFGCAQGRNSMRPLGLALDRLAARAGAGREMMVIHTDLPHCDFPSLFETIDTAPDSYRRGRAGVFSSAIGRSFYERLLPSRSLAFGWSSFALHWLSALPQPLAGHIWPRFAQPGEAEALAAVSAEDWLRFLAHRAEELVPGGRLVLVIGAADDAGATGLEPLMELANGVLATLVAEGRLGAPAHAAMTIPARPRQRAEFAAPFEAGALPALVLDELVIAETPNPAMRRWQETGDAAAFAADVTGFFIAAFGPCLFGADTALHDLFARRLAAAAAKTPEAIARPLVTATLSIARR